MENAENSYLKLLLKNADVGIQQNGQILNQLERMEDKIDHTNGTVKEHTIALKEIELRHKREDEQVIEIKHITEAKALEDKKRAERLLIAVWSVAGGLGTGIILLIVSWISHVAGWN